MKLNVDYPTRWLWVVALLLVGTAMYGQRTISGTITDQETGEPLIGANILVAGTSTGTVTDFDGNFTIDVPEGASQLEISYTGYTTQTVEIGASDNISVTMAVGSVLDEVVVVGYSTVKRRDLTGAVASLGEKDFNQGLVVAPDQLIQGRTAGVQVTNNSGQPGGATTVRIRGNASIRAGNDPLFVVDGVQLNGGSNKPGFDAAGLGNTPGSNPLNYLNPADIESIEVLKDASATGIYGSRGANGVVIITTKRGQTGAPLVTFDAQVGVSMVANDYEVLDGNGYRQALSDYGLSDDADYGENVDAFDEITRTGLIQQYNMSVSGGSDDGRYRVSLGYFNQDGVVKENNLTRINANISGNYKFTRSKRLGVDFNVIVSRTDETGPPISTNADFRGSIIGNALQWNPTHPLYDDNGDPIIVPQFGNFTNPVALLEAWNDRTETTNIIGSVAPYVKILDNLTYKFQYAVDAGVGNRRGSIAGYMNLQNIENRGLGFYGLNNSLNQIFTHTLQWEEDFGGLRLNFLLGYEFQEFRNRGASMSGQDFILDDFNYEDILQNSSQGSRNISSFRSPDQKLQSYFGRFNFNLLDQFLLTATVRADGSSKFGENNRYGVFPAVAFAWNIHNTLGAETFDQLKLRLGWGQVGNQAFPPGAAQSQFAFGLQSLALSNVANPDLKWEVTTTLNAGIDFSLFDYRLNGTVEWFYRNTSDLLFQFPTIQPAPAGQYWVNLDGNVINTGVELSLDVLLVESGKFSWSLGGNVTFIENELRNYNGPETPYGQIFGQGVSGATAHQLANNTPLNAFYLRRHIEIDPNTGQSVYETDAEGNDVLDFRGDPNPDVLMGLFTTLTFGQFALTMNFNGSFGADIYNNTKNTVIPIGNLGSRNLDANLVNTEVQEAISNPIVVSDRYLEDGSFFRFANFTLAWNFGSIGNAVSRGQLFLTGSNIFNITNYTGFDPEVNVVNNFNGLPSFGIEYTPYPPSRNILLGVRFAL